MPNTVIQLKRSATPAAAPSALDFGELALNYADGKIYYKNTNGNIVTFGGAGGLYFGTINANGTAVVADSSGILNLVAGNNITFGVDAVNERITINGSAGGGGSGALSFTSTFGDGSANTFNIAHNLNTTTIIPAVREVSSGYYVYPDMKHTSANTIVLEFISAPTLNQYLLIVLGA